METQPEKELHVGRMLRKYIDEKKYNQAALARKHGWKARDFANYFKRPTVQVITLFKLSEALQFNFLRQIADMLPVEFPPHASNPLQAENDALKKENEKLKIEMEVWKQAVGVKS